VQVRDGAVEQFVPTEARQVHPGAAGGRAPADHQPAFPVHRGRARLVQGPSEPAAGLVEAGEDQRHVAGRHDMVLHARQAGGGPGRPGHVVGERVGAGGGVRGDRRVVARGEAADGSRVQAAQVAADQGLARGAEPDRIGQRRAQDLGAGRQRHGGLRRRPPADRPAAGRGELEEGVPRQRVDPVPDREAGERMQQVRMQQVQGKPALVDAGPQQPREHVGPARSDRHAAG
jgi:hypothetical protein